MLNYAENAEVTSQFVRCTPNGLVILKPSKNGALKRLGALLDQDLCVSFHILLHCMANYLHFQVTERLQFVYELRNG